MTVQQLAGVVCSSIFFLASGYSIALGETQDEASTMSISDGKMISMEYTLTLEDKKVIDSNVGGEPLNFTQGSHQIIPGLETELAGMKVGQSKQVTVAPEQGYGPINPKAVQEVQIDKIPKEARKVGAQLSAKDDQGRMVHPRVVEVKEKVVMLDFNHPLAGKELFFDVKILDIKPAATPEP